jgi:hypothetical protein
MDVITLLLMLVVSSLIPGVSASNSDGDVRKDAKRFLTRVTG